MDLENKIDQILQKVLAVYEVETQDHNRILEIKELIGIVLKTYHQVLMDECVDIIKQ